MKKIPLLLLLLLITTLSLTAQIGTWKVYNAFGSQKQVVSTDNGTIYTLSDNGTLYGLDAEGYFVDIDAPCYGISTIGYSHGALVIAYEDALLRVLYDDGTVVPITGIRDKGLTTVQCMVGRGNNMYLGMDFGVLRMDVYRAEVSETYYLGPKNSHVNVHSIATFDDTLVVSSRDGLVYRGNVNDALYEASVWYTDKTHKGTPVSVWHGYVVPDSIGRLCNGFIASDNRLYDLDGTLLLTTTGSTIRDVVCLDDTYWLATDDGLGTCTTTSAAYAATDVTFFQPAGPVTNNTYRIRCVGSKTYIVPGGYFATPNGTPGTLSVYDASTTQWWNYRSKDFQERLGFLPTDLTDVCAISNDHFFVSSFGYGILEFDANDIVALYMADNSDLEFIANGAWGYTWVDAMARDDDGNIWFSNISTHSIKARRANGSFRWISNPATQVLNRCQDIVVWAYDQDIKFFTNAREGAGIGCFDSSDSTKYAFHNSFVDQDDKSISPAFVYALAQDHKGALWLGTSEGPLYFPNPYKLFEENRCVRIKVPRDDGSDLGDRLLQDEVIRAIAVDGDDNKWFGTDDGAFYVDDQGNIIYHFTIENSPLPSNSIQSIAISPYNGEVFFGTSEGIATYMGAPLEPSNGGTLRVWPNPIRPDYDGDVVIDGTQGNKEVYVVNSAGDVVYRTRSHGGRAIWSHPHNVPSGPYMIVTPKARGRVLVM